MAPEMISRIGLQVLLREHNFVSARKTTITKDLSIIPTLTRTKVLPSFLLLFVIDQLLLPIIIDDSATAEDADQIDEKRAIHVDMSTSRWFCVGQPHDKYTWNYCKVLTYYLSSSLLVSYDIVA